MKRREYTYTIEQDDDTWYVMKKDRLGMSAILSYSSEDVALHVAAFLESVENLENKDQ